MGDRSKRMCLVSQQRNDNGKLNIFCRSIQATVNQRSVLWYHDYSPGTTRRLHWQGAHPALQVWPSTSSYEKGLLLVCHSSSRRLHVVFFKRQGGDAADAEETIHQGYHGKGKCLNKVAATYSLYRLASQGQKAPTNDVHPWLYSPWSDRQWACGEVKSEKADVTCSGLTFCLVDIKPLWGTWSSWLEKGNWANNPRYFLEQCHLALTPPLHPLAG